MSFKTALSGLNAAQADLNVIGNNIANVSTFGFKKSRAEFVDVYAASYQGISRLQTGAGVRVAQIQQNMSQGLTTYTDNNLDLAIQGRGFFQVSDGGGLYYSRAGMFSPDENGYVVNSRNQRLQVFAANSDGTFNTGSTVDLQISTSEGPPSQTTDVDLGINLNAEDTVPAVGPFDPADPLTYNYATSVTTYDSLGATHLATTYYVKTGANSWEVYTSVTDSVDDTDGTAFVGSAGDGFAEPEGPAAFQYNQYIDGPHTLDFNPDGSLNLVDAAATPTTVNYSFSLDNGAIDGPAGGPPFFDFTIDFANATQYANDSGVTSLAQDGYATGLLTGVDVDDTGVVSANYTNGVSTPLGKVALGNFQNPQGLQPSGDSTWQETYNSGEVQLGEPGTGNLGLIQGGALEDSNVNLSEELVSLIVAQRNFQANAQAITTENTITQTIIQIR
ncbi:MAG: flagellar hook protein FlgE [Gammaproteobacteria bacterium]|nr:flagellar hook protein FlgE [Gammaproteobacteria bacterium]